MRLSNDLDYLEEKLRQIVLTCNAITPAHQKVTKVARHMSMLEGENEGPISNHMQAL